jgi:hypothetical protein
MSDRIRTNWRSGEWQAGAGLSRQETNVSMLPNLPKVASDQGDVSLVWSAAYAAHRPWYGNPTVSATVNKQIQRQTYAPSAYLGTTVNNSSWQGNLNLSLAHEVWSTQIGIGSGGFDNSTLPQLSTQSKTVTLGGQWRPSERFSIGPTLQWSQLTYLQSQNSDLIQTGSVFADFSFIPDVLTGNLNSGVNLLNRSVDSQREVNRFLSGEMIWRLQRATSNRPGWDLRFAFTHQEVENYLDPANEGYVQQVFLGLTMNWPVAVRRP